MKYNYFFYPLEDGWCLPASLQTILQRRGFHNSQSDITKKLKKASEGGFIIGKKELEKFFEKYDFKVEFYNPFLEIEELDVFLPSRVNRDTDLILAYDISILNGTLKEPVKKPTGHISIVTSYENESIELTDPCRKVNLSTREVKTAVNPSLNTNYGFYIIE